MDNRPIGFFDSGLGGLTCIPFFLREFPMERIVYFGDTARTPYGSKPPSVIRKFASEIAGFLVETHDVKMIVLARNTVSAVAADEIMRRYPDVPVIGIIDPAARVVANTCSEKNRIGIIGTKVTIESKAYMSGILNIAPTLNVFGKACPALVPLIEENLTQNPVMDLVIKHYLDRFLAENEIDTLVLGCTHYPLIRQNIDRLYKGLRIIDPSEEIIRDISDALKGRECDKDSGNPDHVFYASDLSENFVHMINLIFSGIGYPVNFKNFDLEEI
jgi:glutamate racemase